LPSCFFTIGASAFLWLSPSNLLSVPPLLGQCRAQSFVGKIDSNDKNLFCGGSYRRSKAGSIFQPARKILFSCFPIDKTSGTFGVRQAGQGRDGKQIGGRQPEKCRCADCKKAGWQVPPLHAKPVSMSSVKRGSPNTP